MCWPNTWWNGNGKWMHGWICSMCNISEWPECCCILCHIQSCLEQHQNTFILMIRLNFIQKRERNNENIPSIHLPNAWKVMFAHRDYTFRSSFPGELYWQFSQFVVTPYLCHLMSLNLGTCKLILLLSLHAWLLTPKSCSVLTLWLWFSQQLIPLMLDKACFQ